MPQNTNPPPTAVNFHYLKAPAFRNVHVDGVFGGISPAGLIHAAVFCERAPLPRVVTHSLSSTFEIGDEVGRSSKDGIVRELEVNLVLSEAAARVLHTWLGQKLAELDEFKAAVLAPSKGE